jgi:uncharacterized protein Usg
MIISAAKELICLRNPSGPESPAPLGFPWGKNEMSRVLMIDAAFLRQIEGFSLTTAEIIYRLPDHQMLLQSYIWQDYDVAPRFPKLTDFLDFWQANLDGPLYRVRVAHRGLIAPTEFNFIHGELRLH